jgi:hypothetical protein
MKTKFFKLELEFEEDQTLKSVVQKLPCNVNYIKICSPFLVDFYIDVRLHRLIWSRNISVIEHKAKHMKIIQITQQEYISIYWGKLVLTAQNLINQNTNKQ